MLLYFFLQALHEKIRHEKSEKQAGAELGQAHPQLELGSIWVGLIFILSKLFNKIWVNCSIRFVALPTDLPCHDQGGAENWAYHAGKSLSAINSVLFVSLPPTMKGRARGARISLGFHVSVAQKRAITSCCVLTAPLTLCQTLSNRQRWRQGRWR